MALFGTGVYGEDVYGVPETFTGTGTVRHRVNISSVSTIITDIKTEYRRNQFDDFGAILSLKRLDGETNWEFKRRIHDAGTNLANSSYRGMINGVTRELGFSLFGAVQINPRRDQSGRFLATDPYIKIDGVWIKLYSDYKNDVLDWAIDRFEPGGNYEHLGRLVDMINTTVFFEASLVAGVDPYTRSMTLLNQSNRNVVTFEKIPNSDKFQLLNPYLVRGTVFFNNRTTFRTEVSEEGLVLSPGDYWIDYPKGIIKVFTIPSKSDSVRYQYTVFPLIVTASPVIIHDISNDNFKVKMFNTALYDGVYQFGTARELGVDIINELMSVVPLYWGV